MSCHAHNVLGFERGVKEAIYIWPMGPTLKRDGGRYNLPSAPVGGTTFFLKCRTGRGTGPGPINNDVILAHYARDTTPASAYVNKTSVEVESFYQFSILVGFLVKKFAELELSTQFLSSYLGRGGTGMRDKMHLILANDYYVVLIELNERLVTLKFCSEQT